jgi:hypothetical protein
MPHSKQTAERSENGAPAARIVGMHPAPATHPAANHNLRLRAPHAPSAKAIAKPIPTSRAAASGPNRTTANIAKPQTVVALNKPPKENRHPPCFTASLVGLIAALMKVMYRPAGLHAVCSYDDFH